MDRAKNEFFVLEVVIGSQENRTVGKFSSANLPYSPSFLKKDKLPHRSLGENLQLLWITMTVEIMIKSFNEYTNILYN